MRLDEITLVKETETLDTIGQPVVSTTTNTVIAEIKSVTRNEFFQGRQGGITPDILFEISVFDYDGEKVAKWNNTKYAIYRTYETDNDRIELYCQVDGGVTNG